MPSNTNKIIPQSILFFFVFIGVFSVALPAFAQGVKAKESRTSQLTILARVLSHIERYYVEDVDSTEVLDGAIRGMVRSLDPHSTFLTPDDFAILEADTEGRFGGVGLEVTVRNDILTVVAPIAGTPAEQAGVLTDDQIIAIEKVSTLNMGIDDAVRKMRGEPGTKVTITLRRPSDGQIFDVDLERQVVRVQAVRVEALSDGFWSIAVRGFQRGTAQRVRELLEEKEATGELRGIVMDLRHNPGGLLEEAVDLTDLFVSSGLIVSTRGRNAKVLDSYSASRFGTWEDLPMVVLIDGASASAAEIFAGAIQDHGRALVVGLRSFGKGSVQSIIELGRGYGLKLTISRYFTPSGRSIQAEGVLPDIVVESREAPAPDQETATIAKALAERRIPGHLTNAKKDKEDEEPDTDDAENIEDYQLRLAYQLVRGLAASQHAKDSRGR